MQELNTHLVRLATFITNLQERLDKLIPEGKTFKELSFIRKFYIRLNFFFMHYSYGVSRRLLRISILQKNIKMTDEDYASCPTTYFEQIFRNLDLLYSSNVGTWVIEDVRPALLKAHRYNEKLAEEIKG